MTVSRRTFIKGLAASGAAMSVSSPILASDGKPSNIKPYRPDDAPNLLIVFPDEMRAHALQFMGEDPSITPNLNKFGI